MASSTPVQPPPRLVVNADDYGYFRSVTRGILATVDSGAVTATGVLANGPALAEYAPALRERPELDVGVHLNLTLGEPVTAGMRARLVPSGGRFPGRAGLLSALLTGALRPGEVVAELRAQIERCLELGLTVRFLNGHEHVHMLPTLFSRVRALASEYGVAFVRFVIPEWRAASGLRPGALARSAVLQALALLQGGGGLSRGPTLLGAGVSGRLTAAALDARLARVAPGSDYELMCHPGYRDPAEVRDPALLAFHHWDEERELLAGPGLRARCEARGVRLVRFRDLAAPALAAGSPADQPPRRKS
jgi:predicted glycoside hydrolase/deacetylase ChbG (UPF0249 family)